MKGPSCYPARFVAAIEWLGGFATGIADHSVAALGLLLFVSLPAAAADWPQFLGPARDGHAGKGEPALPDKFDAEPKVSWEKKLGTGFAGPAVADGKAIIFHREGDEVLIEAVSSADGKAVWKFVAPTDYTDSFGFDNGPRATPTIAGGRVFAHGADGMLYALDFKSGKLLWSYDTRAENHSPQGFFGRACAPLVIGGRVIVTPGGTHLGRPAGVIALDVKSGRPAWQSVGDEAGCSSPVQYGDAEKPRLLCWMRNELWSLDATTGGVLHHKRLRSDMDASVNAATPVAVGNGSWFVSAEYGVGATIWKLEPEAAPFEARALSDRIFGSHYSTPVFSAPCIYGFSGRQERGQTLRCIDPGDGTLKWESPRVPGGTLILVGDKLVCVTEQGELWIVKATPARFEQLVSAQILRAGHRSHPAYADGVLFARDGEKLVAVKMK